MWPFTHKYSLAESGVFKDFKECHCHLLPGVDDGIKHLESTLKLLSEYEQAGVSEVWLTPHIMEDVPNTPEHLKEVYESVLSAYKGPIPLHLAAENMLDNLFVQRIAAKDVLPIGSRGRYLLVETSYFNPPMDFEGKLESVMKAGFYPILAHPERYLYMEKKDYKALKAKGVRLQLNLYSLVGAYGDDALAKSQWMLSEGMYDMAGTDTHSIHSFEYFTSQKVLRSTTVDKLLSLHLNSLLDE